MTTIRKTGTDGKAYDVVISSSLATIVTSADGSTATVKQGAVSVDSVSPVPVVIPGLITNFTMTPGSVILVDGDKYAVQTAGKSYSLTNPDSHTLRFEIHQGERWAAGGDGPTLDRADVQNATKSVATSWGSKIPAGTPINLNYQFMVEANSNGAFINSSAWTVVGDMHNDDIASGVGTSPPFAFQLAGNHLQIVARYVLPGGNPSNSSDLKVIWPWTDPNPIKPDVFYDIDVQANFSNNGGGYLKVLVNGNQIVNYQGPLGYGQGVYWKYGIYRATAVDVVAVNYRNMSLKVG